MNDFFKELFEYSHHFNKIIIEKFKDGDLALVVSDRSMKLFSHILDAHSIWNSRINKAKVELDVWQMHSVEQMEELEKVNFEISLEILENKELDQVISYRNSKGESFQNNIKEILFHVINHSTYHRGQLAADFRKTGIEPVVSDYIFYKRKNDFN